MAQSGRSGALAPSSAATDRYCSVVRLTGCCSSSVTSADQRPVTLPVH